MPDEEGPELTDFDLEESVLDPETWEGFTAARLGESFGVSNRLPEIDIDDVLDLKPKFDSEQSGQTVSFRCPDGMLRLLDILLHKEGIPYETKSDACRDGLWYLCQALVKRLKMQDATVLSYLHEQRVRSETAFLVTQQVRITRVTHDLRDHLVNLLGRGDYRETQRVLTTYWHTATGIPIDNWRQGYLEILRRLVIVRVACRLLLANKYDLPADMIAYLAGPGLPAASGLPAGGSKGIAV